MPTDTTEAALEACIERFLTGNVSTPTSNDGKVQEDAATYQAGKGGGYLRGQSSDFNAEFALDEAKFWQWISPFRRRLRISIRQTVAVVFNPIAARTSTNSSPVCANSTALSRSGPSRWSMWA